MLAAEMSTASRRLGSGVLDRSSQVEGQGKLRVGLFLRGLKAPGGVA